jgi:hypothetical protein
MRRLFSLLSSIALIYFRYKSMAINCPVFHQSSNVQCFPPTSAKYPQYAFLVLSRKQKQVGIGILNFKESCLKTSVIKTLALSFLKLKHQAGFKVSVNI